MQGQWKGFTVLLISCACAAPVWSQEAASVEASPSPPEAVSIVKQDSTEKPQQIDGKNEIQKIEEKGGVKRESVGNPKVAGASTKVDANQTPQPLNRVKKSKKGLLDFNRDGTINLRDAFRLAGLRGRLDRVAGMTSDGRLAFRDPKKLLGDALIDFLEDGKIRVTPSSELIGVDIARFNGSSKISYSHKHKRLTLYKTWVFK